jgi:acyl carrier protein
VWPLKTELRKRSRQTVDEWLIDWFVAKGKIGGNILEEETNDLRKTDYFDAGWLTSMEVVEFVTEIEQRFGMQFSDRDLQDPRFVAVDGLAELIRERSTRMGQLT